jgi:hypothetical protein
MKNLFLTKEMRKVILLESVSKLLETNLRKHLT